VAAVLRDAEHARDMHAPDVMARQAAHNRASEDLGHASHDLALRHASHDLTLLGLGGRDDEHE
jgi:hypothetical protein